MSCLLYALYYCIFKLFCPLFELHFLIYLTPLMHLILVHILFSFLLIFDSFVYSWQKGREYTGVYTEVFCHFYITHVHMLKGRNFVSCTFIGGESHRGDAYTKEENKSFYEKTLFCLLYIILVFSLFYGALSYV